MQWKTNPVDGHGINNYVPGASFRSFFFKEAGSIARRKLLKANVSLCNLDHFFRFCAEFLSSVGVVAVLLAVRHHLVAALRDLLAVLGRLLALRQGILAYHIIFIESQARKKSPTVPNNSEALSFY